MDDFGSVFRTLFLVVAALFCNCLYAQDSTGSAYGESIDITVSSGLIGAISEVVAVESGPLPVVSGATPPDFMESDSVASLDVNANVTVAGIIPTLVDVLETGLIEVETNGDSSPHADSMASVEDLELTLVSDPLLVFDLLLLGITGTNNTVVSSAVTGGSCEQGLTATGDTVLTNLELSGLVADTLMVSGSIESNPAPNTVLLSATLNVPGVVTGDISIILNEQIPSGDGVTSAGMTVNAIHISVDDLTLLGLLDVGEMTLNGDVIISQSVAEATCPQADLDIAKSDDIDPIFVGNPLTYTVTVTNDGPDDASNVQVIDTLPPSVTYVNAVPSQGSCMEAGLVVTCDLGPLPAIPPGAAGSAFGEYLDLSFDSSFVPLAVDLDSGPTPSVSGAAPVPFNENDSVVSISESTSIQLGLLPLLPSTLDVLNTGTINVATMGDDSTPSADSSASVETLGLSVLEVIPGFLDLLLLDLSADAVDSSASAAGTCGSLAAVGSSSLTNANLDSEVAELLGVVGALDVNPLPNTVLVDADMLGGHLTIILNEQILTGNGTTSAGITVNAIHITLTGLEIPLTTGLDQLVRVNGEVIISQSTAEVDCSGDGIASITISVIPNEPGVIFNDAMVDSEAIDPVPDDNIAQEPTTVLAEADLSITKDNGTTTVVAGGQTVYTIVASNGGPSDVTGASVDDMFPTELTCTYTSVAAGGATGNTAAGAGDIADSLDMPAGSSVTYTVSCNIDPAATGTIANTVTITPPPDVPDPDPKDNTDTDTDDVIQEADLSITKDNGTTIVIPGETTIYTIVASNGGPSDITGAEVNDTFPPELSCTYTSVAAGGASGNTVAGAGDIADMLDMPFGSSVTYTATCEIDPAATGTLVNTATITPPVDVTDPDLTNNSDTDSDEMDPMADLGIVKVGSPNPVNVGEILTYTLTVTNHGPGNATGVTTTDNLPATVTFVSVSSSHGSCMEAALVVTCDLGTIAVGDSAIITIEVIPNEAGTLTNEAYIELLEGDPEPENDIDDETTLVEQALIARFLVTKTFSDGNPAEVVVVLDCNTGLPLMQTTQISEGDPVNFVVKDFENDAMDCEVYETIPAGYLPTYSASGDSDNDSDDTACYFFATEGLDQNYCEIFNELQPVDVVVAKEWVDEHPEFILPAFVEITLVCDDLIVGGYPCLAEGIGGEYCAQRYIDPDNPGEFEVMPHYEGTSCFAQEELIQGVLTDDSNCAQLNLLPGQGDSCVIVNTRLFAGIPTLNRYGLILLVLMMIGIGVVGLRRYA